MRLINIVRKNSGLRIKFLATCIFSVSLIACRLSPTNSAIPTSSPTAVGIASNTPTTILTTPRITSTVITPTLTPLPNYPLKEVLFNYTVRGFHTPYEIFFVDYDYARSFFVIYTDGQVIFSGNPYQEKTLSADELNQFLKNLDSLGFYNLNNEHLYDVGNQELPEIFDGTSYCVSVTGDREQHLCAYEPYENYLLPEMKNILFFLNNYQPNKMSPYYSDRILLRVQAGRSPYSTNLPKDSILWTEQSVSLETDTEKIVYVDGDVAKELNRLYGDKQYFFVQNGKEYTVSIQEVLPHHELTNIYQ